MSEEEPFFIVRNGAVWACWLSGKPAVNLGGEAGVLAAMRQFLAESPGAPSPKAAPAAAPASPPRPAPAPPPAPPPPPPPRNANERHETRHDISIVGRVRSGTGSYDVTIHDLSEKGCRFHNPLGQFAVGRQITIKIGPIGPIPATVRWCRGDDAGVEFDTPLYPSVLEHIRQHFDLRRG